MTGNIKALNGRGKFFIAMVSLVASFFTGAVASAYYFGGVAQDVATTKVVVEKHLDDTTRHETPTQKETRITKVVVLYLAPIAVELRAINQRLERIENK